MMWELVKAMGLGLLLLLMLLELLSWADRAGGWDANPANYTARVGRSGGWDYTIPVDYQVCGMKRPGPLVVDRPPHPRAQPTGRVA